MLFPVPAFKDYRSRLTLPRPLNCHCPSYLFQRNHFTFSMGVSLTYSISPSPEFRPQFMKVQSKKRVVFSFPLSLTSLACLGIYCPSLEDNVQQGHPFFLEEILPLGLCQRPSRQNAIFHHHFSKLRLLFIMSNIIVWFKMT